MSSTESRRKAERASSVYLEMRGYQILEQNFRRPLTEIDIIAMKDKVIYFVEVNYRLDYDQFFGMETITVGKLRKIRLGAELWISESKWDGEYSLAVIEIGGPDFVVMNFIDNAY
jgi:putative endonuclease